MSTKRNIITLLFPLFVFFLTNGFANAVATSQAHTIQKETRGDISQSRDAKDNKSITCIDGVLQTAIKINQRTGPTFQSFKNNKRAYILHSTLLLFQFSKSYYSYYSLNRINTISVSPFYITYRRLII